MESDEITDAAMEGDLDLVKYYISSGKDPRADLDYAFRNACAAGHMHIVRYLHEEHGADANACGSTALLWAVDYNHLEVVKYLVENGADVFVDLEYQRAFKLSVLKEDTSESIQYIEDCRKRYIRNNKIQDHIDNPG